MGWILNKALTKRTLAYWLLPVDLFSAGLCYHGNFGVYGLSFLSARILKRASAPAQVPA